MGEHQQTELLKQIRDVLEKREQSYEKYLEDNKAEYSKYVQEASNSRQLTGVQVGAISAWLFLVVFAANVLAGLAMKALTFIDVMNVEVL